MLYKLIIATKDDYGDLRGYTIFLRHYHEVQAVLDAARTTEDDFDRYESYDDFVANSVFILGLVGIIDEHGNHSIGSFPRFADEDYAGHALFENGKLTESGWSGDKTKHFLEKFYGVSAA